MCSFLFPLSQLCSLCLLFDRAEQKVLDLLQPHLSAEGKIGMSFLPLILLLCLSHIAGSLSAAAAVEKVPEDISVTVS